MSLGLLTLSAADGSAAFPFDPADGPVQLDTPNLVFLDIGPTGYELALSGSVQHPFTGTEGEKIHIVGAVTINAPTGLESEFGGGLLVLTSIREMNVNWLTCAEGSFPARLPFTVTSIQADAIEAIDNSPGALCDFGVELNPGEPAPFAIDGAPVEFLALQFSGAPGETHNFEFDLEVLPGNDFSQAQLDAFNQSGVLLVNRAFAFVPEPRSLPLLSAGICALALISAQKRSRRHRRGRAVVIP